MPAPGFRGSAGVALIKAAQSRLSAASTPHLLYMDDDNL